MASETFKKIEITHLSTQFNDGVFGMCSFAGCDSKASNRLQCGNTVQFACDKHLAEIKTALSASSVDDEERVCSQDGPNDLTIRKFDHPAV